MHKFILLRNQCGRGRARFLIGLSLALAATAHLAHGQESGAGGESKSRERADRDVQFVSPFLGERTFLILKADVANISLPDLGAILPEGSAEAPGIANFKQQAAAALALIKSLSDGQPIYAAGSLPAARNLDETFLFRRATTQQSAEQAAGVLKTAIDLVAKPQGDYLLATVEGAPTGVRVPASREVRDSLAAALSATDKFPLQLAVLPPPYVRRTIRELSPNLPNRLGGGPSSVLTDGVQWLAIGLRPDLQAEVLVQSASEEAAREFARFLPELLQSAVAATGLKRRAPPAIVDAALSSFEPEVVGDRVRIRLNLLAESKENRALLAALAAAASQEYRFQSETQKIKQILLALHNYHDVHRAFPVGAKGRDKDGQPRLSWRVHILPYLGESALYDQFHLDEPWDSEHNQTLIAKMPKVYARDALDLRDKPPAGHTTFQAPVGPNTIFGGRKPTAISNIVDGTSNTIALLDVKPELAAPWSAPRDYKYDLERPLAGVAIGADGAWLAGFADGSVRRIPQEAALENIRRWFTMNGRDPINE